MWKLLFSIFAFAITTSHAADLYCNFNGNQCFVDRITNVTSPNEVINVIGQGATYTDPLTIGISLYDTTQFEYFPTNIFKIFPNLESLNVQNNTLRYLVTDAFNYCGKLKYLMGNLLKFTNLPNGFAQNCGNITYLWLTFSDLATLEVNALQGLISLQFLALNNNKITCIPVGFFTPVSTTLETIDLQYNLIVTIDIDTFKSLPALKYNYLSRNNITYIPNLNTVGTGSATNWLTMEFIDNPIVAIEPNMASNYFSSRSPSTSPIYFLRFGSPSTTATTCFAAGSYFELDNTNWNTTYQSTFSSCYTSWPQYATQTFSCGTTTTTSTTTTLVPGNCASDKICRYYLDYMDRYTCVIDGVDGVLTSISGTHISALLTDANVTRVYFRNSFLSRVPPVLFSKFPNLEFLSVANCSLGMITSATISTCGNLAYLDARFNDIFHVSSNAFINCQSLQTIDFTGNPIDVLDTSIFAQDPSLKKVILNAASP